MSRRISPNRTTTRTSGPRLRHDGPTRWNTPTAGQMESYRASPGRGLAMAAWRAIVSGIRRCGALSGPLFTG